MCLLAFFFLQPKMDLYARLSLESIGCLVSMSMVIPLSARRAMQPCARRWVAQSFDLEPIPISSSQTLQMPESSSIVDPRLPRLITEDCAHTTVCVLRTDIASSKSKSSLPRELFAALDLCRLSCDARIAEVMLPVGRPVGGGIEFCSSSVPCSCSASRLLALVDIVAPSDIVEMRSVISFSVTCDVLASSSNTSLCHPPCGVLASSARNTFQDFLAEAAEPSPGASALALFRGKLWSGRGRLACLFPASHPPAGWGSLLRGDA